jgi:hypothetical protein
LPDWDDWTRKARRMNWAMTSNSGSCHTNQQASLLETRMGTARDGVVISLRSCDRSFQRTAPPDSAEPPFASDFSDRHPAALLNPPIPLVHLKFTKEFSRLRKILHFSTVARGSQRKMATAAGNTTTAQPMYRPMDRQRNEIRLLRILPCSLARGVRLTLAQMWFSVR